MQARTRVALVGAFAASLVSIAAVSAAGPAGNVQPHRHYVSVDGRLVPVGPQVCGRPSLQHAFNQFHANVHFGAPGIFAMDHAHNDNDITSGRC